MCLKNGVKRMLKHLTIHLTKACNLNCENCHVAATAGLIDDNGIDKNIIENLFVPSLKSVSIAGGEPFYVKEKLYEFLKFVPKDIESVAITTNGLLINNEDFSIIKNKKIRLQFSVDGNANDHENNRGKGTYKKIIDNIKKAVDNGIRVDILTTVSNKNINDIYKFIREIDVLGVENISLLHFTPKGRGVYRSENEVSKADWIRFCYDLKKMTCNVSTRIWVQPRFITIEQLNNMEENRKINMCNCHRFEYAYVDIDDGVVYPCGLAYDTPLAIGTLKEYNIDYLIKNALEKNMIPIECSKCSLVSKCGGGAKCYAWLEKKRLDEKDPWCKNDGFVPICPFPAVYVSGPKMKTDRPTIV